LTRNNLKVYIDTVGCFKNQEDSERAAGVLENAGHTITEDPENADVIIVNTCGFIEDAKRESLERIFELANIKKETGAGLIVSGCLSQRYSAELFNELSEADAVIGVNEYEELPGILSSISGGSRICASDSPEGLLTGPRKRLDTSPSAFLKVAEGCDNRCSYCAIPGIRGAFRSMPLDTLLREAEGLAAGGAREICLIAQDVNAYGIDLYGRYALPELLQGLCGIGEVKWLRLLYCYEDHLTDEMIESLAKEDKICKYIDLPLQHISDGILRRMGRRSTRKSIETSIKKLRSAVPGIAIRTTLMTGFPGESEADHEELMEFVISQRFERLGVFAFSPEDGTPAEKMNGQVGREIAERRRDEIMRTQLEISRQRNQSLIGRRLTVLVEEQESESGSGEYVYTGRTEFDAPEIDNAVIVSSDVPLTINDFSTVEITDACDYDIIGTCVDS